MAKTRAQRKNAEPGDVSPLASPLGHKAQSVNKTAQRAIKKAAEYFKALPAWATEPLPGDPPPQSPARAEQLMSEWLEHFTDFDAWIKIYTDYPAKELAIGHASRLFLKNSNMSIERVDKAVRAMLESIKPFSTNGSQNGQGAKQGSNEPSKKGDKPSAVKAGKSQSATATEKPSARVKKAGARPTAARKAAFHSTMRDPQVLALLNVDERRVCVWPRTRKAHDVVLAQGLDEEARRMCKEAAGRIQFSALYRYVWRVTGRRPDRRWPNEVREVERLAVAVIAASDTLCVFEENEKGEAADRDDESAMSGGRGSEARRMRRRDERWREQRACDRVAKARNLGTTNAFWSGVLVGLSFDTLNDPVE
ncbi:hypothetical protein MBLNU459_g4322t1 [Dothideomycetes sp. NU459]